ncbi:MAG: bile acid:sodium symporter, partial [Thauera sp.]|nr:bile acid:sodium symporter [Thauera sp.]
FTLFPLLGLALGPVLRPLLGEGLWLGMLYLCLLPGTVQSAIAFTSIARGNIPAAVCAASASSLVGIVVTPLLAGPVLGSTGAGVPLGEAVAKIGVQLLLPFAVGHALRPWIGDWVARRQRWLRVVDQGSILLVVYTAFGAAVLDGLWHVVPASALAQLVLCCVVLLALVLVATTWLARAFGFDVEDEITIVFCGSKKSMATGVPMAQIIFSGGAAGLAILPLMVFHQIQLMVCAVLARRYAERERPALAGPSRG